LERREGGFGSGVRIGFFRGGRGGIGVGIERYEIH